MSSLPSVSNLTQHVKLLAQWCLHFGEDATPEQPSIQPSADKLTKWTCLAAKYQLSQKTSNGFLCSTELVQEFPVLMNTVIGHHHSKVLYALH